MPRVAKRTTAVLVILSCLLAVAGCGGGKEEHVVVRVGDNTITAATVDHWIRIESVTSHGGARVIHAVPKGALPVPPEYTDCVQYLTAGPQTGSTPTKEEARVKCAEQYKAFKETVLGILISYYWDTSEGAAKGVSISDAEVTHFLAQIYPHPGELGRYLKITHETLADDRMLVRGKLMTEKLVALTAQGTHSEAERIRAITKHISDETAKWTPKTSCSPGYVVSQCKQYHGPQA